MVVTDSTQTGFTPAASRACSNLSRNTSSSALLQKKCFENGLILERGGRNGCVLRLLPSLLITNAELEIFLDKFENALNAAGVKPV